MKIQKIILPITGQPVDTFIRRYALYFASKLQASLLGIHAGKTLPSGKPTETGQEEDNGPFQAFIKDCHDRGLAFETLPSDDPWERALDVRDPIHLTVLPSGKRFQLPNFQLDNIISTPSRPVLFCPDHYIDIESIALAYDGSENAKSALDFAVWLSDKANWPLSVLMVADSQDQGVRWMDDVEIYLDSLTINSTTIILSGPVDKSLHRFMQEGSVELLIMGARGNRAYQSASTGHTAAYMIEQADFPFLMVF